VQGYDAFQGKTFQLHGPAEYSYKEVAEFVSDVTLLRKPLLDVPVGMANFLGKYTQHMINPIVTPDMVSTPAALVRRRMSGAFVAVAQLFLQ
jgi:hypothetical protein